MVRGSGTGFGRRPEEAKTAVRLACPVVDAWVVGSDGFVVLFQKSVDRSVEVMAMAFVQIIELRTSRPDEMEAVADEWEKATENKRTARRRVLCRDRDASDHYVNIVFFDSYEEAMANSALPETDEMSKKLADLTDGAPTFYNLDVVDDRR